MFLQFNLAFVRTSSKVPELILQCRCASIMNICVGAIFKSQIFVDISWSKYIEYLSQNFMKHEIFTVEINNHRLVGRISSTQNKNSVPSWWCCCCRSSCRGRFRNWGRCKTVETAAGTSGRTIFLAGTFELSCFESCQTIIFALFIIVTVVQTSPVCQTIVVNASVPVLVIFYYLILIFIHFIRLYSPMA